MAAFSGDLSEVRRLLAEGVDVAMRNECNTALVDAVRNGATECVSLLLSAGARPEVVDAVTGDLPLWSALDLGHYGIAELLVTHGAQLDATWLARVIRASDQPGLVGRLIDMGAKPDRQDPATLRRPLHEAAMYGHTESVLLLLGAGANPVHQDRWGETALSLARRNGHIDIIDVLEKH